MQKVEDGSIDVGIVTLPAKSPSLKIHPIFRDRVMLMVNPRNPLAKLKTVRMKDIAEQPLIFPRTGYTRQLLDKHFRPYKPQLQITMELTSVGMIKCFVAAGLGVSLISASFARNEVRAGEVKLIPIADVELWRELGIVYRRDRTLPRSSAAFIALVRQRAAENPDLEVVQPRKARTRRRTRRARIILSSKFLVVIECNKERVAGTSSTDFSLWFPSDLGWRERIGDSNGTPQTEVCATYRTAIGSMVEPVPPSIFNGVMMYAVSYACAAASCSSLRFSTR